MSLVRVVAAVACLLAPNARAADDLTKRLEVSPDGHYLTEPDGSPFFWLADTAWDLFQRLDREEVDDYFEDRAGKGFTIIQAAIDGASSHQGSNRYGDAPFLDNDPTRPNEAYFAHVAWVIDRARHHGLRMAIFPYWAAAFHMRAGLVGEPLKPTRVDFNPDNGRIYGRWLGQRYRHRGVSWIFGGDSNPLLPRVMRFRVDANGNTTRVPEQSDMSARDWRPFYDAMAKGLAEGEGREPFITYHPTCCTFPGMPKPLTSVQFADRPWLTMNMIQSSHYETPPEEVHGEVAGFSFGWRGPMNYEPIFHEFSSKPTKPVIDAEPRYEDIGKDNDAPNVAKKGYWTGYDARNAAYHAVFAGAAGHAYGNHAVWQFADEKKVSVDPPIPAGLTWREALQRPVSGQLRHLKALMLSRPYFTRVPDQSLIIGDPGSGTAHIGATRDSQGQYAMVYLPHGQKVTLDLSLLAGPAIAWWFDPRTGAAERLEGEFPPSRSAVFTAPSNGNEEDWVLVLDDVSKNFGVPGAQTAQGSSETARAQVDSAGTVHLPAFALPFSSYASEEARKRFIDQADDVVSATTSASASSSIADGRARVDDWYRPKVERAQALYPVDIETGKIGGVRVDTVVPRNGIAAQNRNRVLINLHGGAFTVGAVWGGLAESIPIADVAGIKVITVDYRMAPEHKFPAASEDVASVYKELLKQYEPENIGIYGCSAGGMLTSQSVAWFQKERLPRPGAIGIFCAGDAIRGGDSRYLAASVDVSLVSLASLPVAPPALPNPPVAPSTYFASVDRADPLASPVTSPDVLRKFPPTLLITGTRDFLMSSVINMHRQLVNAGVDADLHVWDGMGHNFLVEMDLPESREAYAVIAKFFQRHLGT